MTRKHQSLAWLVYGAIALTLVMIGSQLWTTDLGMDDRVTAAGRIVTEVDPGGAAERAGIAVGDEIVQDPGLVTYVAPWTERELYAWNYRLHRALESGHVPMQVRRAGVERSVDVMPGPAPSLPAALRQLRRFGTQLPATFAFLGVATVLARRRSRVEKDERAKRTIAASCALLGTAWVTSWPAPGWPLWLYPLSSLVEVWGASGGIVLLAHFAWSYPTRSRLVDRPAVRRFVLAVGAPCGVFSVLNSLHVIDAPRGLHGNSSIILFDSLIALATLVGLVWQRWRARELVAKRQTTWLLVSCGAGMFIPILFLVLPQYALGGAAPILHVILLPFPLLIPIGFAAVVSRHRLFSLDGIALRAGPYAVAVATSLLVCVAVTLGVEALFSWRAGTAEAGRWLGTVAAVVLIEPLRRGFQVLIDRAFSRDRDAFLRRCSMLAANLAGRSEPATIEAEVQARLDAKVVRLAVLADVIDAASVPAVQGLLARSGTLRVVDLPDPLAVDALHALGFELLVVVPSDGTGEGAASARALALTLPSPAHLLARAEHDALALVGRVIGAALARDVARRSLESELLRAADERRHIAMELHDGIGATLTAARSMTRRLRAPTSGHHAASPSEDVTLDALDATLREGLGELRTSLWSLDPAEGSWDGLVAKIRRQVGDHCAAAGIELTMTTEGGLGDGMSPAVRLAVLRVVQEAVSNAIKHGTPKHIELRMSASGGSFDVVVEDDGIGLTPAVTRGRGLGNMARRIESLAGTFRLERGARGGTRVFVSVPESTLSRASAAGEAGASTV